MTEKTLKQLQEKLAKATLKSARKLEKLQMRIEEKEAIANGWEVVVNYHDSERTKLHTRCYVDQQGRKQGLFRLWYSNGKLSMTQEYKDGKRHGRHVDYSREGGHYLTCTYVDDVKQGPSISGSDERITGMWLYKDGRQVAYIDPDALGTKETAEEESI
jgi:antitoxin component YwqK of YwqJK toxin-antitoxin module